jgi:hypothetical protein
MDFSEYNCILKILMKSSADSSGRHLKKVYVILSQPDVEK